MNSIASNIPSVSFPVRALCSAAHGIALWPHQASNAVDVDNFSTPARDTRKQGSGAQSGELGRHPQEPPYSLRWLRSMLNGHSPLHDEIPCLTFLAIDWLDSSLKPDVQA
jgi:hypothetical protein